MRCSFFVNFFLLISTTIGCLNASPKLDNIATQVFLGQTYPSGNIYLKSFSRLNELESEIDDPKSFSWPRSIFFQSLSNFPSYATKIRKGRFSSIMTDAKREIESGVIMLASVYIPSLESMDDRHEGCSAKFYKPKNQEFKYLERDFFNQVSFNCNSNEGISIYKSDKQQMFSFPVFAFDPKVELIEIKLLQGELRPLTGVESSRVKRAKETHEKNQSECTTVPNFIDAAQTHLIAKIKGTDVSIRISSYSTAGCSGHLAKIYLLDVLKSMVPIKIYKLIQYEGAI